MAFSEWLKERLKRAEEQWKRRTETTRPGQPTEICPYCEQQDWIEREWDARRIDGVNVRRAICKFCGCISEFWEVIA